MGFLQKNATAKLTWPTRGPCLKPIRTSVGYIWCEIWDNKNHQIQTLRESQATVNRGATGPTTGLGMRRRIEAMIAAHRGYTRYWFIGPSFKNFSYQHWLYFHFQAVGFNAYLYVENTLWNLHTPIQRSDWFLASLLLKVIITWGFLQNFVPKGSDA